MLFNRRQLMAGATVATALPGIAGRAGAAQPEAVAPPDLPLFREDYAVARKAFRTKLVKHGPAPDEPQPQVAPPGARQIVYRSGDLDLIAWVSPEPQGKGPHPAVLFLHGGFAMWPGHWDMVEPFVQAGYVAMMPAMRGENGLPGSYSGFYDETGDVLAAANVLRQMPSVDASRLHLVGHSVGGTLTMLSAMSTDIFRAASAFAGNPDARRFFRRYAHDVRFDISDPREFDMRSAACFAGSFKCPILLQHGTEEQGNAAAVKLTTERAREAGLDVRRGTVPGNHTTAIPGQSAEALKFFAGL